MKCISWNVNGLRACMGKGFADFFAAANADLFCLQETKLQAGQIDFAPPGYHAYWNKKIAKTDLFWTDFLVPFLKPRRLRIWAWLLIRSLI